MNNAKKRTRALEPQGDQVQWQMGSQTELLPHWRDNISEFLIGALLSESLPTCRRAFLIRNTDDEKTVSENKKVHTNLPGPSSGLLVQARIWVMNWTCVVLSNHLDM